MLLSLPLALLLTTPSADVTPPAPPALYAVVHRGDVELRDALIRNAEVRWDAGEFLVAGLENRTVAALSERGVEAFALGALPFEGELWIVDGVEVEHLGESWPTGAQLLFEHDSARLFRLPAGALDGAGHSCHTRQARIPTTAIAPPVAGGFTAPIARGRAADPRIQALVDQVTQANLVNTVTTLSSFFTRRATSPQADQARDAIRSQFQGYGLTTRLENYNSSYVENVIAELPGALRPNEVVIIGAHFDSINLAGSSFAAPGADDNASGSSGVLEAARILANAGPFERTLRFITFGAEELGLVGSAANAASTIAAGEEVVAMLNMDMISYRAPGDARDCDFVTNNATGSLIDFADATAAQYVSNWASNRGTLSAGTSDHQSYFQQGLPAIFFFEDIGSYYPQIHTANDTMALSTNDFGLAEMIVKGVLATAATLAEPLDMQIAHTPLPDSQSPGPYAVQATVTSLTGSTVTGATLSFSTDGGQSYQTVAMSGSGATFTGQIPGAGSPVTHSYFITATDDTGATETLPEGADQGGQPFRFFVGVKSVLYASGFEGASNAGWTHGQVATQDDWQRGGPNGAAGDPGSAFEGTNVWGNDLAPSGWNGEYAANVENWLRSPAIDASAASSVTLSFRRWLTVEDALYDQAEVYVDGTLVWQNPTGSGSSHLLDSSWVPFELDVTTQAAGKPGVQVEFRLRSDGGLQFGGWNLDAFELAELSPVPASIVPYGCGVNPANSLTVISGSPRIGTSVVLGVDNPLGTQAAGALPILAVSLQPDPSFPCGTLLPGFGMSGNGELLVDLGPTLQPLLFGAPWTGPGNPAPVSVPIPSSAGLIGLSLFTQGLLFDPTSATTRFGLADAVELRVGP